MVDHTQSMYAGVNTCINEVVLFCLLLVVCIYNGIDQSFNKYYCIDIMLM